MSDNVSETVIAMMAAEIVSLREELTRLKTSTTVSASEPYLPTAQESLVCLLYR